VKVKYGFLLYTGLAGLPRPPFYPLANEVAKGYSNATVCLSFRYILVNTLQMAIFALLNILKQSHYNL
jgi:hypothetical protein